jgi:hypothetical protein
MLFETLMAFLEHDSIYSKNMNGHVAGQHDGKRDQGKIVVI